MFSNTKALAIPDGNVVQIEAGGKVLWKSGPLPAAYQQVEWIRADNGVKAHIDLGFVYDTKATVHLTQWYVDESFVRTYVFGVVEDGKKRRFLFNSPESAGGVAFGGFTSTSSHFATLSTAPRAGEVHEYILHIGDGELSIEDVTKGLKNTKTGQANYTSEVNVFLFAQYYNGALRYGGTVQLSTFKYYDKNDTLICDLIPCYRKSDGVIGMYDIVRKIFLTNAGSGSFSIPGGGT